MTSLPGFYSGAPGRCRVTCTRRFADFVGDFSALGALKAAPVPVLLSIWENGGTQKCRQPVHFLSHTHLFPHIHRHPRTLAPSNFQSTTLASTEETENSASYARSTTINHRHHASPARVSPRRSGPAVARRRRRAPQRSRHVPSTGRHPLLPRQRYVPHPTPPHSRTHGKRWTPRLTCAALIDHYSRPRNPGSMDKKDPSVGTGLVGAPACGDVMKLQIKVDEKTGTITDAKFKTFGCGSAIASSSYLTTLVKVDDAAKIRNVDISKELCLPPVKLHCSMLAEDAIKAAIADYHGKNPKASISDLAGTARTLEKETAAA
ncbi:iron sulfur cluster assembly protein 1 [Purpureocillium lilacinum]|uniref:Iron sulfur cluster assembly protein 1 n=1 Tax=Purpureocillium lilacinum TaxID=33203 RepID=A0A2U3E9Z7_PURLI|nr:iron sulfur cluster assembly protein 1 [Purpureocillium lilacinum]